MGNLNAKSRSVKCAGVFGRQLGGYLTKVEAKLAQWKVNIVGRQNGYFKAEQEQDVIEQIKASGAKFISVAMGTPKQELLSNSYNNNIHKPYIWVLAGLTMCLPVK